MKKISEFQVSKAALLSEMEKSNLSGGRPSLSGPNVANTSYYGPENPTSITTYDGIGSIGEPDGLSGTRNGDTWTTFLVPPAQGEIGKIYVSMS